MKFGIQPGNKRRKRLKTEGMFKNLFKNIVFGVFWLNSGVKEGIWGQNSEMVGCSYHSRTNSKNSPSKPWEIEDFSSFVLIFPLVPFKIWQAHLHKNYIFKINNDRYITSQSLWF